MVLCLPVLAGAEMVTERYQHGRFEVENTLEQKSPSCNDTKDRRCFKFVCATIYGGVFTPPPVPPKAPSAKLKQTGNAPRHFILINYQSKELMYYRKDLVNNRYQPIVGYAVVTPAPSEIRRFGREEIRGEVTRIVYHPKWCVVPGGDIQRDDPSLRGCYEWGHPSNPMGDWKFDIDWEIRGIEYSRIHGTAGYPRDIRRSDTYGCTSFDNGAIAELVRKLGGDLAVEEGIEVITFVEEIPTPPVVTDIISRPVRPTGMLVGD